MAINLEKIKELYGEDVLEHLKDEYNYNEFEQNIIYLKSKNIENIEDIIERYYLIFLTSNKQFKEKVNNLIEELGDNYIELLEEDISHWERLL